MPNNDDNRPLWRFFDGSVSVSVSMLLAVSLNGCAFCDGLPVLGLLKGLTMQDDGVIIVATLLLFPTTVALYGGFQVFFAAKEAVEKRARERGRREGVQEGIQEGRREGVQEGRREERERISKALEQRGVPLTPEQVKALNGDSE